MMREGRTRGARAGPRIVIGPWRHTGHGHGSSAPSTSGRKHGHHPRPGNPLVRPLAQGKANGVDRRPGAVLRDGGQRVAWRDGLAAARTRDELVAVPDQRRERQHPGRRRRACVASAARRRADGYRYDPRDPVPACSARASSPSRPTSGRSPAATTSSSTRRPPLAEAVEVTATRRWSSAPRPAPDTDFFARLIDVAPDGLARDVALGMVRARYRDGLDRPGLLTPGEVRSSRSACGPTANASCPATASGWTSPARTSPTTTGTTTPPPIRTRTPPCSRPPDDPPRRRRADAAGPAMAPQRLPMTTRPRCSAPISAHHVVDASARKVNDSPSLPERQTSCMARAISSRPSTIVANTLHGTNPTAGDNRKLLRP